MSLVGPDISFLISPPYKGQYAVFCILNACTVRILNGSGLCQVVDTDLSSVPVIQARKFSHETGRSK